MIKNIFIMSCLSILMIFVMQNILSMRFSYFIFGFYFPKLIVYSLMCMVIGSIIGTIFYFLLQKGQKSIKDNLCIFLQVITSISLYLLAIIFTW